jgi:hypothetical protein
MVFGERSTLEIAANTVMISCQHGLLDREAIAYLLQLKRRHSTSFEPIDFVIPSGRLRML